MFVGTVLIQWASTKSVETGIWNRVGSRRHSIDCASCWERWRGSEAPEGRNLLWLVGNAPGQFLGDVPNRAHGQDGCHAATSSVFCNPAENEIGTCQGVC